MTHNCRVCNVVLNDENWAASGQKEYNYICKKCRREQARLRYKANPERERERQRLWQKANPEKAKAIHARKRRKQGIHPYNENKKCSSFLGVYVAERVLSHVFKHVKIMPYGNPGFDFICNRNKMIDVKSSCLHKSGVWMFTIKHNTIADYFLCLAFDNREDLNPLYAWLIPGKKINHLKGASIRPSTIHKWDDYKLDINKVVSCCNVLRNQEN